MFNKLLVISHNYLPSVCNKKWTGTLPQLNLYSWEHTCCYSKSEFKEHKDSVCLNSRFISPEVLGMSVVSYQCSEVSECLWLQGQSRMQHQWLFPNPHAVKNHKNAVLCNATSKNSQSCFPHSLSHTRKNIL